MGRLKLNRLMMQSPKQSASLCAETSLPNFTHRLGFAHRTFEIDEGWCGGEHPIFGASESALLGAMTGDFNCVYETLFNPIFIDTETTGLGHGTGTFAFLVGIAYRTSSGWLGEQLLVSAPAEEKAMLQYLNSRIRGASALVSYNGKSFDMPLLRCRNLLHRINSNEPIHHFDLYRMASTVLKDRLSRKRLIDIEQWLFEQIRYGDIEGANIPNAYFRFLHRSDTEDLNRVVHHNELDVVTMPKLTQWLIAGLVSEFGNDRDELCFLERCFLRGLRQEILPRVVRLKQRCSGETLQRVALLQYQLIKDRDLRAAIGVLKKTYGNSKGSIRGKMARRLAIHYEHDLKDFRKALDYAQDTETEEGVFEHQKRVSRLHRKLSRLPS